MNPLTVTQLKEEAIRWIISVFCAVFVYAVVAYIIQATWHPDIEVLKSAAADILIDASGIRPEPVEALLFRLGVIIIIPGTLGFYILFSKTKMIGMLAGRKSLYLLVSALCLALIVVLTYFDFAALNPYGPMGGDVAQNNRDAYTNSNFDFYFQGIFLGDYLWLYLLVIVPLVACLFFIGIKKYNWEDKKAFKIISSESGYLLVCVALIAIVLMNTYHFPYSDENKYDFGAVYYSMTQVYAGVPMLANHFTSTYGLYAHFLNPIFQLIGLNVFKFSLVMSLLTGLSFLLNFYLLKQLVRNKVILFLGFATVFFFSYLDFFVTTKFDSLFACFPIRYLVPSTIALLAALYFKKPTQKKYWIISFAAALFILWNPEMGLVCYISWIIVNVYNDFYTVTGSVATRKILIHLLSGVCVLLVTFCVYELLVFLFYGVWADLWSLFAAITYFGKLGVGLLPMDLVHPWNLMAIILILGFAWPAIQWCKKEVTPKSTIVLLISLIGLGYFVYFQGRSQNSNFAYSSGFCLILLTILGDELWHTVKKNNIFLLNGLFVVFLFFISCSFPEILFNTKKVIDLFYQEDDKNSQLETQHYIEANAKFIQDLSGKHKKILVLTQRKNQSLFFDGSKRVSAFNPGLIDLFLKADLARLENLIIDSSYSVFTEPGNISYSFLERPMAAVAACYEYKAANGTIVLFKKRKPMIPAATFFTNTDQLALHRKYTDDNAGIHLRINDALGIDSVMINPVFSVEALFYLCPQTFPKATLLGNLDIKDTCGFAIGNIFNSSKYFCMINKYAFVLPFQYNKWTYLVVNVYADHIDAYKNGDLVLSRPLPQPMRKSPGKLYVGTMGKSEYFVAPISELAITNKTLDSNQIRSTWNEIKQELHQ